VCLLIVAAEICGPMYVCSDDVSDAVCGPRLVGSHLFHQLCHLDTEVAISIQFSLCIHGVCNTI
jgi:hypothetical protein